MTWICNHPFFINRISVKWITLRRLQKEVVSVHAEKCLGLSISCKLTLQGGTALSNWPDFISVKNNPQEKNLTDKLNIITFQHWHCLPWRNRESKYPGGGVLRLVFLYELSIVSRRWIQKLKGQLRKFGKNIRGDMRSWERDIYK